MAKRNAATELLRTGRLDEAAALAGEAVAATDAGADHLLLARIQERRGLTDEAVRQYRKVLQVTADNARTAEDRDARLEAERRVKALDPAGEKLTAATDEFLRKLDALERDAVASHSMASMERLFRLRGAVWAANPKPGRGSSEVKAKGEWQDSGIDLKAGHAYKFRVAGLWRVKGKGTALVESTANGIAERPANSLGRIGQLVAQVGEAHFVIGEVATITPKSSGRLYMIENDEGETNRVNNTGSVQVLVEEP